METFHFIFIFTSENNKFKIQRYDKKDNIFNLNRYIILDENEEYSQIDLAEEVAERLRPNIIQRLKILKFDIFVAMENSIKLT